MYNKEGGHIKYYHNGKEIPSCTTILKILDKPGLVNWANSLGFKRLSVKAVLNERSEYGTYCHKLFELYFSDAIMSASSGGNFLTKDEYREIIYKFRIIEIYFKKLGIEIINTELAMHGTTYGGTLDMLCYNREKDCLMIFDLKTSKTIYDSHWLQLMGYVQLVKEIYGLEVEEVGIILLSKPMNSPEIVTIRSTKECWREKEIFNKLRDIYYYLYMDEERLNEFIDGGNK